MKHQSTLLIYEIIRLTTLVGSLLIFISIFLIQVLSFLLPEFDFISNQVPELSKLRYLIANATALASIGWVISVKLKRISMVNPLKLEKDKILTFLVSSYFFAFFYSKHIGIIVNLDRFSLWLTLILTLTFFLLLPQIVNFYTNYKISDLIRIIFDMQSDVLTPTAKPLFPYLKVKVPQILQIPIRNARLIFFAVIKITLALGAILIFTTINIYIGLKIVKYLDFKEGLKEKFYITDIIPASATHIYTVELKGYNFGWNTDQKDGVNRNYRLLTSSTEIIADTWSNEYIKFVLPWYIGTGTVDLWLEKPQDGKIMVSNKVKLNVLPRDSLFPTSNDELLQKLIKKIKRIILLNRIIELQDIP